MKVNKPVIVRQGDVLLFPVDSVPKGAKKVTGRAASIIQEGEVTGHHHAVSPRDTEIRTMDVAGTTDEVQRFLSVHQETELTHQEHATITIPPGDYEIRIQREYSPEEIRQVAD